MKNLPLRALGKTAINVSQLGLGTVKFGRTHNLKYPQPFSLPGDKELDALLKTASEHSINLLDTAAAYDQSEERLGKLLKNQRQRWVISSKAGEEFEFNPNTQSALSRFDFSAKHLRFSLERSLRRLRTDYLDIFLLHCPDEDLAALQQSDAIETLERFKQEGWIRAHGASTKTREAGMLAAQHLDVLMVTLRKDQADDLAVIEACQNLQKGILLKKVLNSGQAKSPAESLAFALAHPAVSSVIVGTINPHHLAENIATVFQ